MAYIAPATANKPATIELSQTIIAGPAQIGTTSLNAALVTRTLMLAARQKAGFTQPRASAPTRMYTNPDGTLTTDREGAQSFDREGFYSHD